MYSDTPNFDEILRGQLKTALAEPGSVHTALERPDSNLFDLGLDSLRAFALIEELADHGVEIDFLDFTEEPTCRFLRAAAREVGHA